MYAYSQTLSVNIVQIGDDDASACDNPAYFCLRFYLDSFNLCVGIFGRSSWNVAMQIDKGVRTNEIFQVFPKWNVKHDL